MPVDLSTLPGLSPRMRALIQERDFLAERKLLEDSFIDFAVSAWGLIESRELVRGWHVDALAEHMQAFSHGEMEIFMCCMPPRLGKSTLFSILYPCWRWTNAPEVQFMSITFGQNLSARFAQQSRRLIKSDWYQQRWGDKFHVMEDQDAKLRYDNNKGGYRFSASVEGGIVGFGASEVLVDDPHETEKVESDTQRQSVITFHDDTLTNRMNDQLNYREAICMQRLHEGDLIGHQREKFPDAVILNLPMEFEPGERSTTIVVPSTYPEKWTDPREEDGELLCPKLIDRKACDRLKATMSAYGWAGRYQQNPQPKTGGVFEGTWFNQRYDPTRLRHILQGCDIIQSWDTATKELQTSAYSVCTTWAVHGRDCYLLHVWRQKVRTDKLEVAAFELMHEWNPSTILIEDKSSGSGLINAMRTSKADQFGRPRRGGANIIAIGVSPKFDKIKRAEMTAPFWSSGRGWLPHAAPWLGDWLQEHLRFPKTTYADQVDSTSQFVNWLTKLRLHANTQPANLLSIYQR